MTTGDEGTGGRAEMGDKVSGTGNLKGRGNKQERTMKKGSNQKEEEKSEGGKGVGNMLLAFYQCLTRQSGHHRGWLRCKKAGGIVQGN